MKNSIDYFKEISSKAFDETSHYKFNKNIDVTDKYRKGRLTSAEWVSKIVYIFMQKEKNLLKEFQEELNIQREKLKNLKEGEYKQGLLDELDLIEEISNKSK